MVELKLPSVQAIEITVRDWNNVAHDIASEMAAVGLVPTPGQPLPATSVPPRPVFVRALAPDSAFLREAADQLEADILRRGGRVVRNPAGATVVSLDVAVVRWTRGDLFPTSTEAVWKASVEIDGQLVMKLLDPLYVRDTDLALYIQPKQISLPSRLLRYEP